MFRHPSLTDRCWRAFAVAGFGLGLFVAVIAPAGDSGGSRPSTRLQEDEKRPFSHQQHVPRVWFQKSGLGKRVAEQRRDCRACHRFGAAGKASSPQAECNKCHYGEGRLELKPDPGWEKDLGRHARLSTSFKHPEHSALACRACHLPGGADLRDVPHNLPVPTGAAFCDGCHGPRVDAATIEGFDLLAGRKLKIDDPDALKKVFADRLNERSSSSAQQVFRHRDHLSIEQLESNSEADCVRCHRGTKAAKAGAADQRGVPAAACENCHVGQTAPLKMANAKRVRRRVWSVGTFGHDDHYGFLTGRGKKNICKAEAYDGIQGKSCRHCHEYAPTEDADGYREFPFSEAGVHSYAGCQACHQGSSWRTRVHGEWGSCRDCHAFGAGAMSRPKVTVTRLSPKEFGFTVHAHPHITKKGKAAVGAATDQNCKKCHLREPVKLASRLDRRAFSHDTHLAKQPTDADCEQCHVAVRSAGTAAAISRNGRTYGFGPAADPKQRGCSLCHLDSAIVELPKGSPGTRRVVPRFSHAVHLGKNAIVKGKRLTCVACHSQSKGDMTSPTGQDCKNCHGHVVDVETRRRTGDLGPDEAKSCQQCHRQSIPVTRADATPGSEPFTTLQSVFGGFEGMQHHGAEQACASCHLAVGSTEGGNHVQATRRAWRTGVHSKESALTRPRNCYACHWRERNGTWKAWPGVNTTPEEPLMRAKYGDDMTGFPGIGAEGDAR